MPLTMPEELTLLMLDDESGRLDEINGPATGYAVAASLLAELELHHRIGAEAGPLRVTDPTPTGDPLLDPVLARIAADHGHPAGEPEDVPHDNRWWIETLAREAEGFREAIFARLIGRGILRQEEGRFLWIFPERRYPTVSDQEEREVRARLMAVITGQAQPAPRDSLLLGLVRAAGLLPVILPSDVLEAAEPRIAQVANLEELSRSLSDAVRDVFVEMARYTPIM